MRAIFYFIVCVAGTQAFANHTLENRDIARGQTLYVDQCASCHGANLEGQPDWRSPDENGILPAPPHDETGHTWHHDPQILFDYTKLGGAEALAAQGVAGFQSGMPAFSSTLTDTDIWDILAYIHSTWPDRIKQIQAARNQPHD